MIFLPISLCVCVCVYSYMKIGSEMCAVLTVIGKKQRTLFFAKSKLGSARVS